MRTQDPGPRTEDLGPGTQDPKHRIPGPRTRDPGTQNLGRRIPGLRTQDLEPQDLAPRTQGSGPGTQNKLLKSKKSLTSKRDNTKYSFAYVFPIKIIEFFFLELRFVS